MRRTITFITTTLLLFVSGFYLSSCENDYASYDILADITGKVIDAETGSPISQAEVSISPTGKSDITQNNGTFTFRDLDPEQYVVTVQKQGYYTNKATVLAWSNGNNDVVIALQRINY